MANKTITAANSVFMLAIGGIFPVAQQLQGYAADNAFDVDSVDQAEVVMGVDGHMSAGYVPYMTAQNISLMPDSPSLYMFETWAAANQTSMDVFFADASIFLPSIGRRYVLTHGVLTSMKQIPDVHKVLQAVPYKITWQSIAPSLV